MIGSTWRVGYGVGGTIIRVKGLLRATRALLARMVSLSGTTKRHLISWVGATHTSRVGSTFHSLPVLFTPECGVQTTELRTAVPGPGYEGV